MASAVDATATTALFANERRKAVSQIVRQCSTVGTKASRGGNAKMSACVLRDICSSQRNGARITTTSTSAAACSSGRSHRQRLFTARPPADGAQDTAAQHDRREDEDDGDRARVAEIREVEGLHIRVVVRHLGERARSAVGEDEDQRKRLDAVDQAEQRG